MTSMDCGLSLSETVSTIGVSFSVVVAAEKPPQPLNKNSRALNDMHVQGVTRLATERFTSKAFPKVIFPFFKDILFCFKKRFQPTIGTWHSVNKRKKSNWSIFQRCFDGRKH